MYKEMQWSTESYRLDKVKEIFGLPCVVRLEEGYMPPDESEEFAQGDIITLDTEVPSDKVGAYFIKWNVQEAENKSTRGPDYGIITSDNQEIFLPYSYDGKLKVMKNIAKVNSVTELAQIFPGYAELEGKFTIKTNQGGSVTLAKGTTIELDRVIPGSTYGTANEQDKLVIQFKHFKENKVAAIPFNMKGKFLTKADNKKYTIKEAIDRYGLPLDVKFTTDEIRQKFYQEVLAGRRKLGSVTEIVRLNRIVEQRVLVGHYKPIIEPGDVENAEGKEAMKGEKGENPDAEKGGVKDVNAAGSGDVRRRTVVMIPVDNPEIGEIPVNICEGDVLTIYESLVNIKSVSEARDMVKETLCLDFEVTPGMKLLTNEDNSRKYENIKHGQRKSNGKPPPLPARPTHPTALTTAFEGKRSDTPQPYYKTLPIRKEPDPLDGDYLVPINKRGENSFQGKRSDTPEPYNKTLPIRKEPDPLDGDYLVPINKRGENSFQGKRSDTPEPYNKTLPIRKEPDPLDGDYLVPINKRGGNCDYVEMKSPNKTSGDIEPPVPPRRPKQSPPQTVGSGQKSPEKDKKRFWAKKKSFKSHKKESLATNPKVAQIKPRPRIPDPILQTIEEDDEELRKMKEEIEKQISGKLDHLSHHTYPSDDLGQYEEINGLKPFPSIAEMAADSSSGKENLSSYDEIEDVVALHIQGNSGSEQKQLIGESLSHTENTEHTTESTRAVSGQSETLTETTKLTESDTDDLEKRQLYRVTESGGSCAESRQRSVTNVSPTRSDRPRQTKTLFNDLTNEELVDRLQLCNLPDMADFCKTENLDGAFFSDITPEFLKETMGLQGIKLAKFLKMRDENWVPK